MPPGPLYYWRIPVAEEAVDWAQRRVPCARCGLFRTIG